MRCLRWILEGFAAYGAAHSHGVPIEGVNDFLYGRSEKKPANQSQQPASASSRDGVAKDVQAKGNEAA